jgi:hypothetical protein
VGKGIESGGTALVLTHALKAPAEKDGRDRSFKTRSPKIQPFKNENGASGLAP